MPRALRASKAADYKVARIIPTMAPQSVIEGVHCIVSLGTHAIAPSMFEHF